MTTGRKTKVRRHVKPKGGKGRKAGKAPNAAQTP